MPVRQASRQRTANGSRSAMSGGDDLGIRKYSIDPAYYPQSAGNSAWRLIIARLAPRNGVSEMMVDLHPPALSFARAIPLAWMLTTVAATSRTRQLPDPC